ncbi:MAG TPA: hypothetical protein VNE82_07935 [Candidatus Binataceae bacterium]|nr:hypothetical protein [Candidatus Binataceae bacterium]
MRQLAKGSYAIAGGLLCAWLVLRPAPAAAFDNTSLSGSYAFEFNKFGTCPNLEVTVGVFSFDGSGTVSGSFRQYDSNKNGAGPKASSGTASGTYTVHADGTGTINFTSPETTTFAFAIDSTGTSAPRMELINLSLNAKSCADSGYAIQQ